MTNWWHKFVAQTVTLDGLSMTIKNPDASVPATDGNPMGFPTLFIGNYQGKKTVGSNLPKQVSALTEVPTIFSSNATSLDTSNFNATYDVWFTATEADLPAKQANPGKGGAYLMVWMFDPRDRQPRGGAPKGDGGMGPNVAAHTVKGVDGTWDVWIDKTDPLCISYVRTAPSDGMAFDLNTFIRDSVTNSYGLTSSMYLAIVFAGFEVWGGGDGLKLKQFCAAVN
jgi:cellulose 1,4-beta-cellobiosidase